jgi:hypothetical protein
MYLAGDEYYINYSDKTENELERSSGLLWSISVKLNFSRNKLQILNVRIQLLETHPCSFNWLTASTAT